MLRIREVEPGDIPAVRDVLVATWHATYDPILGVQKFTEITNSWHSPANLAARAGSVDGAGIDALILEKVLER
jgi:hypothetical protein